MLYFYKIKINVNYSQRFISPPTVPSVAPGSPTIVEVRSRSALLQWSIPPRSGRNGIIVQYRVELSVFKESKIRIARNITVIVEDPSFDEPSNITHNVTDLTPFTGYYVRVAAVNDAGAGPLSHLHTRFVTKPDCECITLIYD